MIDLSKFSDTCTYCYKGIEDGISVCSCQNSLCEDHREMHISKFGCGIIFSLSFSEGIVKVIGESDVEDLEKRINVKVKNGMVASREECECPHIYESENHACSLNIKTVKCQECDITDSLWVCLECGHIGCGRQQPGANGNGHALAHSETTKVNKQHCNAALINSINEGQGDTFCYICENFIQNPLKMNVHVDNENVKSFEELTGDVELKAVRSDLLGITNEGVNCYVSAVLQLLNEALGDCDFSDHFMLCDQNPRECVACQLTKVLNEMKHAKDEIRSIRITGFLDTVFKQFGCFTVNMQEDCSEFLQKLLEQLECFEECALLPVVTDRFNYTLKTIASCSACGSSNDSILDGKIFYAPFTKSIKESLESMDNEASGSCKCGSQAHFQVKLTKLSKFLILSIGRYRHIDQKCTKIEDPINTASVELDLSEGSERKLLEIVGCICHKGSGLESGHYTWWVRRDEQCYAANDGIISKSDEKYPENGNLFLLKVTNVSR